MKKIVMIEIESTDEEVLSRAVKEIREMAHNWYLINMPSEASEAGDNMRTIPLAEAGTAHTTIRDFIEAEKVMEAVFDRINPITEEN